MPATETGNGTLHREIAQLGSRHICPECNEPRVLTEARAYLCPNGHGKVICGVSVEARSAAFRDRAYARKSSTPARPKGSKLTMPAHGVRYSCGSAAKV